MAMSHDHDHEIRDEIRLSPPHLYRSLLGTRHGNDDGILNLIRQPQAASSNCNIQDRCFDAEVKVASHGKSDRRENKSSSWATAILVSVEEADARNETTMNHSSVSR
jgi:hypothetical protein